MEPLLVRVSTCDQIITFMHEIITSIRWKVDLDKSITKLTLKRVVNMNQASLKFSKNYQGESHARTRMKNRRGLGMGSLESKPKKYYSDCLTGGHFIFPQTILLDSLPLCSFCFGSFNSCICIFFMKLSFLKQSHLHA